MTRILTFLKISMPFMYIASAIYIFFTEFFLKKEEINYSFVSLGILLVIYGSFRLYRLFKEMRKDEKNN